MSEMKLREMFWRQVFAGLLFLFWFGGAGFGRMEIRSPVHFVTDEGDQMQIYVLKAGSLFYFFLRDRERPFFAESPVSDQPVREIHLSEWEPLYQLIPVWHDWKPRVSDVKPNARMDLSEVSRGAAVLEFAGKEWRFRMVAEPRLFEIGQSAKKGGLPTLVSFPVLIGDDFEDLPLGTDLADFLADRQEGLEQDYRQRLRDLKWQRDHSFVVYPLEILPDSVSLVAVSRGFIALAGFYGLEGFHYRKSDSGWRREDWVERIRNEEEAGRLFSECRYRLAQAIGDPTITPETAVKRSVFVAVPVGGRLFVKFDTYMIGGGVSLMPEMFMPDSGGVEENGTRLNYISNVFERFF